MVNKQLLENAYNQIRALPPEKTLLVLHPAAYQNHRRLCYGLIEEFGGVYINLPASKITPGLVIDLIWRMLQDLDDEPLPAFNAHPVEQMAAVINRQKQFVLVIDGYERVQDAEIHSLMFALAQALQPGRWVFIKGHEFPLELLDLEGVHEIAAILPVDDHELFVDHTQRSPGTVVLEVRSLGPGQAYVNGRKLSHWEGLLPKCLFFFMVDRAMTSRQDIFDTFWKDLKKREATNVFHVTKRKISEILGVDLTTYGASFYRLADNIVLHYDVVTFLQAAQDAAVLEDDEAAPLYERAIRLYRGSFLNTMDSMEWVEERRGELHLVYTDVLIGLARIYQKQDRSREALGLFLRASANVPQREDVIRDLMTLYADGGHYRMALHCYENLEKTLWDSLKVAPSQETQELAERIRKLLD